MSEPDRDAMRRSSQAEDTVSSRQSRPKRCAEGMRRNEGKAIEWADDQLPALPELRCLVHSVEREDMLGRADVRWSFVVVKKP